MTDKGGTGRRTNDFVYEEVTSIELSDLQTGRATIRSSDDENVCIKVTKRADDRGPNLMKIGRVLIVSGGGADQSIELVVPSRTRLNILHLGDLRITAVNPPAEKKRGAEQPAECEDDGWYLPIG